LILRTQKEMEAETARETAETPAEPAGITTSFFLAVLVIFAALAFITNPQVLRGKVPLAVDVVSVFPPWESAHHEARPAHAEVGDSLTLFYPWRVFQEFALHRRELPLWNPRILGGTPFLANAQSALFYPIHLLLLVMHPPTLWTVKLLLNLMLSGVFTALFVRSIGGSRAGAIASGLIFACCGFMAAWQTFTSLADAAIWLPFILWSLQRLCLRPSMRAAALSAVAFAMPVLAGHPETAAHLTLTGIAFAIFQCVVAGRREGTVIRRLGWVALSGILAIGLSAVQIIPTVEWLGQIEHGLAIRWPVRPLGDMLAFLSRDIMRDPNSANLAIPESAAYVTPMALLLAPLALFTLKRREAAFFLLVVVAALSVVHGWWPVQSIVERTPILAGIKNGRLLLVIDFSLAVLAGLGTTALGSFLPKAVALRRNLWAVLCITTLVVTAGIWKLSLTTTLAVELLRSPGASALFLLAGFIVIAVRIAGMVSPRVFTALVLAVISLDMVSFRSGILPVASRKEIFPPAPVFDFLKANADPDRFRVASISATYPSNTEMIYGLAALDGYDLELKLAQDFLTDFGSPTTGISLNADQIVSVNDRRLDLMNLKYLVATTLNGSSNVLATKPNRFKTVFTHGSVRVLENEHVLPRARFMPAVSGAVEVIPDEARQLARVKDPAFDAEGSVVVGVPLSAHDHLGPGGADTGAAAAVSLVSGGVNESVFQVANGQPGLLVVSQIFYPGWAAFVDGKETPVVRADYALTAVPLESGNHMVRLAFQPSSYKIGLAISIASCICLAGLVVFPVPKD
jgi:Bacterial membrane protein YfhO